MKLTDNELTQIRNIKIAHTIFLKLVNEALIQITENNKIIFRRIPDSRLKTTRSILNKFEKKKNEDKELELISYVQSLKDISGLRMTITAKDEFVLAKSILESSEVLMKYGELDTKSRAENGIMNDRGYAAHHYYLIYTLNMNDEDTLIKNIIEETLKKAHLKKCDLASDYPLIAEIQIRTLAQDLWAVFEHPERYKSGGNNSETVDTKSLNTELLNYAKLMNVADDIAQLTKNRKIHAAEHFFNGKRKVSIGKKKLLNINVLRETLTTIETIRSILTSTYDLCDLLMELAENGIFTNEDLLALIENSEYIDSTEAAFEDLALKRMEMEISIADSFQLLFICHDCQKDCENILSEEDANNTLVEQRKKKRNNKLKSKISEIKRDSNIAAILNNFEVRNE